VAVVAGGLQCRDDVIVMREGVIRGIRDHENGHGALLETKRPTVRRGAGQDMAGVPLQVTRHLDATHGFLGLAATVPSADHALQPAGDFLRQTLARA